MQRHRRQRQMQLNRDRTCSRISRQGMNKGCDSVPGISAPMQRKKDELKEKERTFLEQQ